MILTQNTNFDNVEKVIRNFPENLKINDILDMPSEILEEKIKEAGFYKQKSKCIKELFLFIKENSGISNLTNVKKLREKIIRINGIGNETTDVFLLYIVNEKKFVSDAYARRLFSRVFDMSVQKYEDLNAIAKYYETNLTVKKLQEFHAKIDVFCIKFCKKTPKYNHCVFRKECKYVKKSNEL